MSLTIFGLLLAVGGVLLGWKKPRAGLAVLVGLLLGVVIAGSNGGLADAAHGVVDGIRTNINALGAWIFS